MSGAVLLALWTASGAGAAVPAEVRAVERELARLLEQADAGLAELDALAREAARSRARRDAARAKARVLRGRLLKAKDLRADHEELIEGYRGSRGARLAIDAVNRRPISPDNPVFAWAHESEGEGNRLYGLWLTQWSRLAAAERLLEAQDAHAEERSRDRLALYAGAAAAALIALLAYASWRLGRIT